jgi:ribosomal protein S18 acetylase RimI-like enzyme
MATIRKATPQDRQALELCFTELQNFERTIEPNRVEPEIVAADYIEELFADCVYHNGVVLIAEEDNRFAGFACVLSQVHSNSVIEKHRDHAYVTDLYVRESSRGRGIGEQLMRAAEEYALACGAARIRVGVLAANNVAHGLYRKLGYRDYEVILEKTIPAAEERAG